MAGLAVGCSTEYLSVVCVRDHRLGLHWGRESRGRVSVSEPTSSSAVTASITIPSAKESAAARKGLAPWHRKGIWVYVGVISIFLVARFTICYIESVIYTVSSDVIRETTATAAEFNGV